MTPTNEILQALVDLLAADTATLGSVTAMKVHLVAANFTPDPELTIGDLTLATFTGSAAKLAGTGTQQVFSDPVTGYRTIQILEPAGGWTWECTATPGAPETIYGVALTDNAGTDLYSTMLFNSPITISLIGQAVVVANLQFQFPPTVPY
jgi:hypothetical protein